MEKKIGIIGFGNMGSAIAWQLKEKFTILSFDRDETKTKGNKEIIIAADMVSLVSQADILILAVKPQELEAVLEEIGNLAAGKLTVSIAAGITTSYIEKRLAGAKVVRAMPNLPAKIAKGMICLCRGKAASQGDLKLAARLFDYLGKTLILKEGLMDAATAISGSGPGYLYFWSEGKSMNEIEEYAKNIFIPSLEEAACSLGFSGPEAAALAKETASGSIDFLKETNISAQELKKQVASKGGTTEAGLNVLSSGGSLQAAVIAATNRAEELSKKE